MDAQPVVEALCCGVFLLRPRVTECITVLILRT